LSDRWVCQNCSAKNDSVNYTCQKCGQGRGLQPAQENTPSWDPEASEPRYTSPPAARNWTRLLRYWWVLILVFGGISAFFSDDDGIPRDNEGVITAAGRMSVHDLQVGDCFDFVDETSDLDEDEIITIEQVQGMPCSDLHDYEVYVVHDLDQETTYPSEFRLDRIFEEVCLEGFEDYVGSQWELSEIWADMIWPLEEGWNQEGDRTVTCLLFETEEKTAGSLRGSGR